ncbi:MAG: hypothetical protein H6Q00_2004 [Holophagaceae bacterium]|nr:hypothetical protein [Holophagaceae bacterium]
MSSTAAVVQLVRALDCDSRCRGFESLQPPQICAPHLRGVLISSRRLMGLEIAEMLGGRASLWQSGGLTEAVRPGPAFRAAWSARGRGGESLQPPQICAPHLRGVLVSSRRLMGLEIAEMLGGRASLWQSGGLTEAVRPGPAFRAARSARGRGGESLQPPQISAPQPRGVSVSGEGLTRYPRRRPPGYGWLQASQPLFFSALPWLPPAF